MSNKIQNEIEKLRRNKEELIEKLQVRKKDFAEVILNSDPNQILRMECYTAYTRLMDTAKELSELEIKLRVLYFAMGYIPEEN